MSGIGQSEEGVASTSGMMETSMMEGEEYYNPGDTSTWTQKEMSEQLCRICSKPNQYLIPIFEGEGIEHQLESKIQKHLPIEVLETDELPLQVCYQCASTLIAWNDLVIACIEADKKLRQLFQHHEDQDDKGAEFFDEPILDSDEGEEPTHQSTSPATVISDSQTEILSTKRSPGKAKKSKLQTALLKSSTAGPSGHKPLSKKTVVSSQDDAVQEGTERFMQAFGDNQQSSASSQQNKNPPVYYVCSICFQPFDTEHEVIFHKRDVHSLPCLVTGNVQMPLELNIKEQIEDHGHEEDFDDPSASIVEEVLSLEERIGLESPIMLCCKSEVESNDAPELTSEELSKIDSESYEFSNIDSVSHDFSKIDSIEEDDAQNQTNAVLYVGNEGGSYNASSRKTNPKNPRVFPCDICNKSYTRNYDMHKHKIQQHTGSIVNENGKVMKTSRVKQTPEMDSDDMKPYKYRNRKGYGQEEKEKLTKAQVVVDGVKFYHCNLCNTYLKSKYSFVTHLRVHTGEKPYTCHVCGRQFRVWEQLQRHVSDVHDKIKNYECNVCGRKFATLNTRNEHLFTHSQERSFVCHMCGKTFRSNGTLRVHYKFHKDVFPYQCPHCDKQFRMRQHFENHIRVHTGEKPHACTICGKPFRTKWCLKKHTLIHTSTETFECMICRKNFAQKRYLRNHMRLSHSVHFPGTHLDDM